MFVSGARDILLAHELDFWIVKSMDYAIDDIVLPFLVLDLRKHSKNELVFRRAPHEPQRTFSVASPINASTSAMIQNRITIWGSAQPRFSKWWWIGAIRKTRLPVRLK